jgi:hypothetical protein
MKYLKITRPREGGSYIQPINEIANAIDGEFDGAEAGEKICLELVEMSDEEFEALPDFAGW